MSDLKNIPMEYNHHFTGLEPARCEQHDCCECRYKYHQPEFCDKCAVIQDDSEDCYFTPKPDPDEDEDYHDLLNADRDKMTLEEFNFIMSLD